MQSSFLCNHLFVNICQHRLELENPNPHQNYAEMLFLWLPIYFLCRRQSIYKSNWNPTASLIFGVAFAFKVLSYSLFGYAKDVHVDHVDGRRHTVSCDVSDRWQHYLFQFSLFTTMWQYFFIFIIMIIYLFFFYIVTYNRMSLVHYPYVNFLEQSEKIYVLYLRVDF